jgi:hypothetical protein
MVRDTSVRHVCTVNYILAGISNNFENVMRRVDANPRFSLDVFQNHLLIVNKLFSLSLPPPPP